MSTPKLLMLEGTILMLKGTTLLMLKGTLLMLKGTRLMLKVTLLMLKGTLLMLKGTLLMLKGLTLLMIRGTLLNFWCYIYMRKFKFCVIAYGKPPKKSYFFNGRAIMLKEIFFLKTKKKITQIQINIHTSMYM